MRPEFGSGMNFRVPFAAGEKALCGIMPFGKTQFAVLVQLRVLYGSSALTVKPSRCDNRLAQYDPFTTIGAAATDSFTVDNDFHACATRPAE